MLSVSKTAATVILTAVALCVPLDAFASDGPAPSSATASKVTLPDGPASVRGLGSDAEIGIFSAQVQYSVLIAA